MMPVNLAFALLPLPERLTLVWNQGEFLSFRWEEELRVGLYALPGSLLVEVFYHPDLNEVVEANALPPAASLEDYASNLTL